MIPFVYKYNNFKGRYYKYLADEFNASSPMFDESLHVNDVEPDIKYDNICSYCNCYFPSRNKLFHHLNFMGIDTRKSSMRNGDVSMENDSGYNDEKGDFGMELEKRRRHRRRKRYSKQWRYIAMRRIKNDNKRKKIKAIEALLKNVHI